MTNRTEHKQTLGEAAAEAGMPFDHIEYECPGHRDDYYDTHCMFCDGGLFACTRCSSFEGATTTQCPGRNLTETERDDVYAGRLDYRLGHWTAQPSWYCPGGYYERAWEWEETA